MMRQTFTFTKLIAALLFGTSLWVSCSVDDSYDLSEDIDMTMGLGSNGLGLKLGNTENIYLRDILDVDRNEGGMIDTTATGLYYLIKGGNAQTTFNINRIETQPTAPVELSQAIQVSSGIVIPNVDLDVDINMQDELDITVDNIQDDVTALYTIVPENKTINLLLHLEQPASTDFQIKAINNLVIEFPSFVHSSQFAEGTHRLEINSINNVTDDIRLQLTIDSISTAENAIENGTLNLNSLITLKTSLKLSTGTTTNVPDNAHFALRTTITFGTLGVASVTGRFNPAINPNIDPMEIGNDLPNFLKDESVRLYMSNPTLRIKTEGSGVPIPVLLSGSLTSWKNGRQIASAEIPSADKAHMYPHRDNLFYFFEGNSPFDPAGIASGAQLLPSQGLSSLMQQLPDEVRIDMKNGHIIADPAARHTIIPGTQYTIDINYDILLPFSYKAGTRIVYTDSTANINKDIKDYQAEGVEITAKAVNTIPLGLVIDVIPYDMAGNDLSNLLEITPATAAAAEGGQVKTTDLSIMLNAKDRSAVSRIEKIVFRIQAEASGNDALGSDQYIRMEDIRVKLKGQIIADFN